MRKFAISGAMIALALGVALAAFGWLQPTKDSQFLQPTERQTAEAVLARVPLGTEIDRARAIMESEGFRCMTLNPSPPHQVHERLSCDSGERSTSSLFISKRWQVTFYHRAGKVWDISVGVGITGS